MQLKLPCESPPTTGQEDGALRTLPAMRQAVVAKTKKLPKASAELKADVETFEARLAAEAAEVKEADAAARNARRHAQRLQGGGSGGSLACLVGLGYGVLGDWKLAWDLEHKEIWKDENGPKQGGFLDKNLALSNLPPRSF